MLLVSLVLALSSDIMLRRPQCEKKFVANFLGGSPAAGQGSAKKIDIGHNKSERTANMAEDHKCQTFEKDGCPTRSKTPLASNLCAHSRRLLPFLNADFRLEMRA